MGAKTALLAFTDNDIRTALSAGVRPDQAETEGLVRQVLPGYTVEPAEGTELWEATYPGDDFTYAAKLPALDIVADRRLAFDRPSELPAHLLELGKGRRIMLHGMHSVVDWLSFAIWEDGELVRSLSLAPDDGVIENIGEPLDFEQPYWAGAHPVEPIPGFDDEPYPLPFHPLELGEEALRALFGFILEGESRPDDVDGESISLHGFWVTDPTGQEQAAREAQYASVQSSLGEPRIFSFTPGGTMREVSLEDL